MEKDFDRWNRLKKNIHHREQSEVPFFNEREVWWCHLGLNVGWEEDGKHEQYLRPVVVLKKFIIPQKKKPHQAPVLLFWAIPITSQQRTGKFYHPLPKPEGSGGKSRTAILSQVRLVDAKRLVDKAGTVPRDDFDKIKNAIIDIIR